MPDAVVTKAEYPTAAELLKPDLAQRCDVIVFYDMWAKGIAPQQQEALQQLLQSGIGVVALHHTLGAHQDWPEYAKIIGGKYHIQDRQVDGKTVGKSGYSHGEQLRVTIADKEHPITRGLEDFEIHDEAYLNYDTDPAARLLLTTKHPKNDPELAWVKTYGNSRVFYLMLGHDHLAYEHPSFRTLAARGIRWAAGRPADLAAPYRSLFNGKDLTGWKPEGKARWDVQDGLLVGTQGEDNAPGDLFTEASFDDFELKVAFRVVWPANTGVWYRYQSPKQAFQADVLEYVKPFAAHRLALLPRQNVYRDQRGCVPRQPRGLEHVRDPRRRQPPGRLPQRPKGRRRPRRHQRPRPHRLPGPPRRSIRQHEGAGPGNRHSPAVSCSNTEPSGA